MYSPNGSSGEKRLKKIAVARKMIVIPSLPEREQEKEDSMAIELHKTSDGPAEAIAIGK